MNEEASPIGASPSRQLVAAALPRVEVCRLFARNAALLHDGVAPFGIDDPFLGYVLVFVSGNEEEPGWVSADVLVIVKREHHDLAAVLVGTLADEGDAIGRSELVAVGSLTKPLVGGAEHGLVHRQLARSRVVIPRHERALFPIPGTRRNSNSLAR